MSELLAADGGSIPRVGQRVLVVDDEQPLARVLGSYLERDGLEVSLAFDGISAVQMARTVDPDVVVLDLGLPGQNGLEVCRQVRTWVGDEHLVDVHIAHVRRKLGDDASSPRFIRTVRGVGYRMGEG
jgi:DNA-binding response OmpR family regulator